jgi:hypothetical protein
MNKIQITITRIYPKGKKGYSKSMTIEDISVKQAYNKIKECLQPEVEE